MLNVLKNQCGISQAWHPTQGGLPPQPKQFDAIWDTGATNSAITQAVIDACGLVATGMATIHGVHGPSQSETFLVNVALPNQVLFGNMRVTKGNLVDADILIGMDIISQGDFAVTNHGGITKFSFRVPSAAHIDFVEEQNKKSRVLTHGGKQGSRPKRAKSARTKNKKRKKK